MQLSLSLDNRTEKLSRIDQLLRDSFTLLTVTRRFDPVTQLVKALLGARTKGAVSMAALNRLLSEYGSWENVRDQPVTIIHDIIEPVTFAQNKALQLKATLGLLSDQTGHVSLDHLNDLTTAEAMTVLERLPGVGRKVSASVLNVSSLQRRALVIDTHHHRILIRLGLVRPRSTLTEAYDRIMPDIPSGWTATRIDDHHRLFKRLGQTLCRHEQAYCERCPLQVECPAADQLSPLFEGTEPLDPEQVM